MCGIYALDVVFAEEAKAHNFQIDHCAFRSYFLHS